MLDLHFVEEASARIVDHVEQFDKVVVRRHARDCLASFSEKPVCECNCSWLEWLSRALNQL